MRSGTYNNISLVAMVNLFHLLIGTGFFFIFAILINDTVEIGNNSDCTKRFTLFQSGFIIYF